jgi:hypothetical protein
MLAASRLKVGLALLIAALSSGCAHFNPILKPDAEPDPAYAYFYAQLGLEDQSGLDLGSSDIGLRLKNMESDRKVTLRYQRKDPVIAVKVKPGRYALQKVVYVDNFNAVFGESPLLADGKPWTFEARPGRAYYVGDSKGFVGWVGKRYLWKVRVFEDRFSPTTVLYREKYPRLALLPLENALVKEGQKIKTPLLLAER